MGGMDEDAIDRIVAEWTRERPDLDVSPTHVLQRITRLYLLQSASFAEIFARFGLTFGEFEVLAALVRSGQPYRLNPGQLGGALVLSSGAVTNRIDRVEAAGLVERLPDPADRRGTLVALTAKGRRLVDQALRSHLANEERLLGALSASERGQLARLLRKLLVSAAFADLDPAHAVQRNGRGADLPSRAGRTRRR
jgi:DNA-binding MarR family transcriptional regulator